MKERPILMSGPMVRATLENRKTQTRRIVKGEDWKMVFYDDECDSWCGSNEVDFMNDPHAKVIKCPYGVPGDLLWVRETWVRTDGMTSVPDTFYRASESAVNAEQLGPWKPSIFMPRWASRITLEIEAVRVERLIEITEEDCIAEGIYQQGGQWIIDGSVTGLGWMQPEGAYRELWESINGPGSWDVNPYVWVIQFRRITP